MAINYMNLHVNFRQSHPWGSWFIWFATCKLFDARNKILMNQIIIWLIFQNCPCLLAIDVNTIMVIKVKQYLVVLKRVNQKLSACLIALYVLDQREHLSIPPTPDNYFLCLHQIAKDYQYLDFAIFCRSKPFKFMIK